MKPLDRHRRTSDSPPSTQTRPAIAAARSADPLLFISGQTATRDGALIQRGIVGADVDIDAARACAWQCARNVVTAIAEGLGDLDHVRRVVRVTVYVASDPAFDQHHLVADAASEYFLEVFGAEKGLHARAAIGVSALPTGSPVEVDAIVEREG